jgi:hypothetical protein
VSRTLWLHCGSFKSGSSRIQHEAWSRRDELLGLGWLYPLTGLVTDEPDVGVRHSDFVYRRYDADEFRALVDALVAEVAASDCRHVLMSSEAWTRPGSGPALAEMLAALRDRGLVDDVRGVVYLRNRVDYARSFYRELTRRRGNRRPFATFVEANDRPLDPLDTVRTLRQALAPGSLQVFRYEEVGDTGAHFFGLLGLDVVAEEPRSNPGLPAVEVEAYRQLNLVAPELAAAWPGVAAATSPQVDLVLPDAVERLGPGQLEADRRWRADFADLTAWTPEQVEALLRPAPTTPVDVTGLAGVLRGVVLDWLARTATPTVEVTTWRHPDVDLLELNEPDPTAEEPRLTGRLLLAPAVGEGWRLLCVGEHDEREARVGRPSPALARRYPRRADAAHARFTVARTGYGASGRLDLVLEQASGDRTVVATLRRRWASG